MLHDHGGKRKGAGRPAGSNRYGEPTSPVRVPVSAIPEIQDMLDCIAALRALPLGAPPVLLPADGPAPASRPLFLSAVPAGFPSPADDYVEGRLDLNEHFVRRPAAAFFVRVSGESMKGAGILPGDILIVDRSLTPAHGNIVIAVVDGELTVKRLYKKAGRVELRPENSAFPVISFRGEAELSVWGVVTGVTRKL